MAPDAITAELLAKHSAGEKLSQADYGRLGAWKRKLAGVFGGKGSADAQPAPARPGQPAPVDPLATAAAPGDSLADVPLDPGVCQRTTAAILRRLDSIGVRYIEREAAKAGALGADLARFRSAASLPRDDQALIVDLSPDLLREMGLDPRSYPLLTVAGVLGLHATNLWLCVQDLKDLNESRQRTLNATKAGASGPPEAK